MLLVLPSTGVCSRAFVAVWCLQVMTRSLWTCCQPTCHELGTCQLMIVAAVLAHVFGHLYEKFTVMCGHGTLLTYSDSQWGQNQGEQIWKLQGVGPDRGKPLKQRLWL